MTVVLYNRLFLNFNHDPLKEWLLQNEKNFDVIVLQEANARLAKMAEDIVTAYPHQILEPQNGAFGMVILSRHPLLETENIPLPGPLFANMALRIVIQPPAFAQPVAIYAVHPLPPVGKEEQKQRNSDLMQTTAKVAEEKLPHIIMMGDWNITPYSPYFHDILKTTGLKAEINTPVPVPTWPSLGFPWIAQIPIDHFLTSSSLRLLKWERYKPMNSDHYPVIASFALTGHDKQEQH